MNCLDFRRHILADPHRPDAEARAHAAGCAACADFLDRQRELDASLFEAMQVAPPDGLADRILVARGLRKRRWAWPIAASLVLAGALVALWPRTSGDELGREAIAHVRDEPQAFTASYEVPDDTLSTLLSAQGMNLARTIGRVTYSTLCPVGRHTARHLVVRTDAGPVTLLLVPGDLDTRRRAITRADGMAALTVPAARGSIAIVASSLDQALAVEKSLRAS